MLNITFSEVLFLYKVKTALIKRSLFVKMKIHWKWEIDIISAAPVSMQLTCLPVFYPHCVYEIDTDRCHPSLFQSMILALQNCFRWKLKFIFGFEYFSLFKSFKIKSAVQNIWSIALLETVYLYFFLNINLNANIRSVKLNYYSNYPNTMIFFGYSLNIVVNGYGIHSAPYSTWNFHLIPCFHTVFVLRRDCSKTDFGVVGILCGLERDRRVCNGLFSAALRPCCCWPPFRLRQSEIKASDGEDVTASAGHDPHRQSTPHTSQSQRSKATANLSACFHFTIKF